MKSSKLVRSILYRVACVVIFSLFFSHTLVATTATDDDCCDRHTKITIRKGVSWLLNGASVVLGVIDLVEKVGGSNIHGNGLEIANACSSGLACGFKCFNWCEYDGCQHYFSNLIIVGCNAASTISSALSANTDDADQKNLYNYISTGTSILGFLLKGRDFYKTNKKHSASVDKMKLSIQLTARERRQPRIILRIQ